MDFLIPICIIFGSLILAVVCGTFVLLVTLIRQMLETNKRLLIVVAGKEEKPEHALRALIASEKPPQKNLKGIATKTEKKSTNTNYALTVGDHNAL